MNTTGQTAAELTDLALDNMGFVGHDEQVQIDGKTRNFDHYKVRARLTGRQTPLHLELGEWQDVADLSAPWDPDAIIAIEDAWVAELVEEQRQIEETAWFAGTLLEDLAFGNKAKRESAMALLAPWLVLGVGSPMGENSVSVIVAAIRAAKELGLDYHSWPTRLKASEVFHMAGELQESARKAKAQSKAAKPKRKRPSKGARKAARNAKAAARPSPTPTPASTPSPAPTPMVAVNTPTVARDELGRVQMHDESFKWECAGKRRGQSCGARGTGAVMVVDASRLTSRSGKTPTSKERLHRQVRCPSCQAGINRAHQDITWLSVDDAMARINELWMEQTGLPHDNAILTFKEGTPLEVKTRPSKVVVELPDDLFEELTRRGRRDWPAIRAARLGQPELLTEVHATMTLACDRPRSGNWYNYQRFLALHWEQHRRDQEYRQRRAQQAYRGRR